MQFDLPKLEGSIPSQGRDRHHAQHSLPALSAKLSRIPTATSRRLQFLFLTHKKVHGRRADFFRTLTCPYVMPSLTVENYLKAILQLCISERTESISTGQLASHLQVSPGTVTSMLKTLSEGGLATYKPYSGASLTKQGRGLALRILRRHRLIELFLVKTLNLTWDQVHAEAENMEHAVSDVLIERIDEYLGRPPTDPHGDPIPSADGMMRTSTSSAVPLGDCQAGAKVKIVRVVNQQPDFLRYLSENGLELGTVAIVEKNSAEAGIVTAKIGRRQVSLGHPAAEQLLVEPV
jgi:DtxR family Mn-dependent transcriptional regulator